MRAFREVLRNLWKAYLAIGVITLGLWAVYKDFPLLWFYCEGSSCWPFNSDNDFAAFFVTWLEDVIFFSLIGIPAVWMGLRKPAEDHIEYRFRYLFNSDIAQDENIVSEFEEAFTKMAAFCPSADVRLSIIEFNKERNAITVDAHYTMTIANMYKDHAYVDKKLGMIIEVDKEIDEIEQLGKIEFLRIYQGNKPKNYIYQPIALTRNESKYKKHIKIEIPPNGTIFYEFKFALTIKNGDEFWVQVDRFTKDCSIELVNTIDGVVIEVACDDPRSVSLDAPVLKSDEPTLIYRNKMLAYKPVEFNLTARELTDDAGEEDD